MVEIDVKMGQLPPKQTEKIKIVDQKNLIPFLHRCNFKLFGSFFSATMINPEDKLVEFEVSIGK